MKKYLKKYLSDHKENIIETVKTVFVCILVITLAVGGMKTMQNQKAQGEWVIMNTCSLCHQEIAKDSEKYIQFDGKVYHVHCFENGLNAFNIEVTHHIEL